MSSYKIKGLVMIALVRARFSRLCSSKIIFDLLLEL